jgi:TRAP-type uncharacterized transport system substrate-binding protein
MNFRILCLSIIIGIILVGCNSQRKSWTIAVPANNSKYETSASLLQELFLKEGLELTIMHVSSGVEASRMVAEGKADLMLNLAHSDFMIPSLGNLAKELRVVMPLFENAIFIFYRSPKNPTSIIEVTENSKIFLEVPDSLSEQNLGLQRLFGMLNIKNYEFVNDSAQATIIPIWGSFSGVLTKKMLDKKWKIYSMEESFINYARIIEPRFDRLTIPGRYSDEKSRGFSTLLSTGYLITSGHVKDAELYDLVCMLYENRVFFTSHDKIYMAIREDFSKKDLNFPLHEATLAYLNRDQPSFLERHAEYYGLILTILILSFGGIQSFRNYMKHKKKDRIDLYFLEYAQIKNDPSLSSTQRKESLESLHTKALQQMVIEKLGIADFSIFSQMVRTDINQLSELDIANRINAK